MFPWETVAGCLSTGLVSEVAAGEFAAAAAKAASTMQAATNALQALATRVNLTLLESRQISGNLHTLRVVAAPGETLASTLARLTADAAVEFAEPDERRYPHALPNDPLI